MVAPPGSPLRSNRLLSAVTRLDRGRILDNCERVDLVFGETLSEGDSPIRHVHFPIEGYISLITPNGGTENLEVGLVGNEGGFGVTLMLGVNNSPLIGLVQGGGAALRMSAASFRDALRTSPSFAKIMSVYLFVVFGQIAQTAACGRFHHLEARLARWILMTHDRAGGNTFPITHQFLAHMLGVRRSGVTEAAGVLQRQKYIYYRRGTMQILNRLGLEAAACSCYKLSGAMYMKYLGQE